MFTRWLTVAALTCGVFLNASAVQAEYPDRPVRLVVGFAAGGGVDTLARLLADRLSQLWNQSVIVENRVGADGTIGASNVAHAEPDGYTLLVVNNNNAFHAAAPDAYQLNYDPMGSFTPITEIGYVPQLLLVTPSLPVSSVKELIELAKSKPGELNFGSSGPSSPPYLLAVMLMNMTGIDIVNVTYGGTSQVIVALLGGEIQMMFSSISSALPHVAAGKLKALAVTSKVRAAAAPDLPTVAEAADLPDFEASTWMGISGPAGLPPEVVAELNSDIAKVINSPDVQTILTEQGYVTVASAPDVFSERIKGEVARLSALVESLNVKK